MIQLPRYTIHIKASAKRDMTSLPVGMSRRISEAILALESDSRPKSCKKLSGRLEYRIRVGDYRILYIVDDAARVVEVVAVGNRKDVYR